MIVKLDKELWAFHYDPPREGKLGNNIFALFDDKDVLLIDAGYRHHMEDVLKHLKGYNIIGVIPTHFHADHIEGLKLLNDIDVYGNEHANHMIEMYRNYNLEKLKPTIIIKDGDEIKFRKHRLYLTYAPGHSDCSMLIDINRKYLCVGDLYITLNSSVDVLPYVSWSGVKNHISSLEKIRDIQPNKILLSHGVPCLDKSVYEEGISNRLTYLSHILDSDNNCSLEEALDGLSKPFVFKHLRKAIKG